MNDMFEKIVKMHENHLHSSIIPLLDIVLHQNSLTSPDMFSPLQEHLLNYYYGEALCHQRDFRNAEEKFLKSLELRKANVTSGRRKVSTSSPFDFVPEADLKFKIHECKERLHQYVQSLNILEEIPVKQRTSKINLAMAELYRKQHLYPKAIMCYKEVIRETPLAMDSMLQLLKMKVTVKEIAAIIGPVPDWIHVWLEAHGHLHSGKSENKSVELFRRLLSRPDLQENQEIMTNLAQALYFEGELKKSIGIFRLILKKYPSATKGIDCYASCLFAINESKSMDELCVKLIPRCENGEEAPELWVAFGYYALMNNKKDPKAFHFAQKACLASDSSAEAVLLKAKVIAETKTISEAITCLLETSLSTPPRFEVIKALTYFYVSEGKKAVAMSTAKEAVKIFGNTARTMTLVAVVQLADTEKPQSKKEAKRNLEKAISKDRGFLPAAFMLAKIYQEEKALDKAIDLLLKCLEVESTPKLHKMLGDCYTQINDHGKAMHHQNIAAKLEVSVRPPTEASQSLNAQSNVNTGSRGDVVNEVDVDEPVDSENEGMEESETEVVWSDPDF